MKLTTALRNARLQLVVTAAGAGATLKVYTGAPPGPDNAATGTLLSTWTAVTFGTVANGQVAVTGTADPLNAASGTPGYVRLDTSGGAAVADFVAGVGSGEIAFAATVSANGTDTFNGLLITEGNA